MYSVYSYRKLKRNFNRLIAAFKDRPCTDCGGWFEHFQMDFDHRDRSLKSFEITGKYHTSKKRLLAEIAKCDVVCANCHRLRTARQLGWK